MENKLITYPFPFSELLITDRVLDKLGFTEYWDGSGEFGERTFGILKDGSNSQYEHWYRIVENDELDDDPGSLYGDGPPRYRSRYWASPLSAKVYRRVYFLHDLYDDISDNATELLDAFVAKTKEQDVNMFPFIESYLKWKEAE